jgi:putative molybdopterin biosynthesis protein
LTENRMTQEQFLNVVDRDEAERVFRAAIDCRPLGHQSVPLEDALGRVLAEDVVAAVDVPSFDRSNYDGFAVRAADTYRASEEEPRRLRLFPEAIATGRTPQQTVEPNTAVGIATGGMLPRGADAIVMVEHTDVAGAGDVLLVTRAVVPGHGMSFAGTDISRGETVLRRGELLGSRETGVLAAIGMAAVRVWRRPRVGILSTGDELLPPGESMKPAGVYDSNAQILADAVRELGGAPVRMGIVDDDLDALRRKLHQAIEATDLVLLSGGTSKGAGDVSYRAVRELSEPGIVAHGVALKPGKPICLAAHRGKAVVVLPGFPTSAIFTFHEFVAPVIRMLGGRPVGQRHTVDARMAMKVLSEPGRTEFLLVGLVDTGEGLTAYPMGKGSGSVTAFSKADGFVTIGRHEEIVAAGAPVVVQRLAEESPLADLVVIGSHCVGLDYLLGRLHDRGFRTKFIAVGSTGGLQALARGECDLAGIHLFDPNTGQYNAPYITPELRLLGGYGRSQGLVFRKGDPRFAERSVADALASALADPACMMVNRNQGSGTRILVDRLLGGRQPPGYPVAARSHNAVAAGVAQGRADWGVAIRWAAEHQGLGFLPLEDEQYDFAVLAGRWDRPAVAAFRALLADDDVRRRLVEMGFRPAGGGEKAV